jgi:hypothetical protein
MRTLFKPAARSPFAVATLIAFATLGLTACLSGPAAAGRLVDVSITNRDTGERLTPIRHGGKLYVAGTPGQRYAVELRNRDGERLLTVVSVDGINVLTGQTAAPVQSGYVLDPGRQYAINGWRKSMDDVAQFVFTALPDSYAARTGRPDHVGVIGVAAFRERRQPVAMAPAIEPEASSGRWDRAAPAAPPSPANEARPMSKSLGAGSAMAESDAASGEGLRDRSDRREAAKRLGTGHGQREHAPTQYTEFVRASDAPDEVLSIYYDSRSNLIARGILRAPKLAEPQPFPGANGFVPDPRG